MSNIGNWKLRMSEAPAITVGNYSKGVYMAKTSNIVKKNFKYEVQKGNRCARCGRSRGYIRRFGICRICFRELAYKGYLPGVKKSSW